MTSAFIVSIDLKLVNCVRLCVRVCVCVYSALGPDQSFLSYEMEKSICSVNIIWPLVSQSDTHLPGAANSLSAVFFCSHHVCLERLSELLWRFCQLEPVWAFSSDLSHRQGVSVCRTVTYFFCCFFPQISENSVRSADSETQTSSIMP